jgi:hypothetical protein
LYQKSFEDDLRLVLVEQTWDIMKAYGGLCKLHVDMSAKTTVALPTKRECPQAEVSFYTKEPHQWKTTSGSKPRMHMDKCTNTIEDTLINRHVQGLCFFHTASAHHRTAWYVCTDSI